MPAPLLLHLNGPSGVGKSTLARRWADERPGTLDLDIDQLVPLLGGWDADFLDAWARARQLALAMATTHLEHGDHVVLPQLVNQVGEAERFEAAARAGGATYVEVALAASVTTQRTRFRGKRRAPGVEERVGRLGDDVLARINAQQVAYLRERPHALRVETDGLGPDATYAALAAVLDAAP